MFFFYKDQRRKDGNDFEKDTVPGFQNTPALHLRAKTYSALSFDQINFFNMANLFSLSRKPFVVCYCFREPIKTFFLDACQMIVKSCVLHLFPVLQTGRSHKALRAWAINRWKKTRSIIYSTDRKNEANKRYIWYESWIKSLFCYSFKIIPSLKTWLTHAYLHRSIDVKFCSSLIVPV